MIFPANYYWSFFADAYLGVYGPVALACILFQRIVKAKWKLEIRNWLYVFNTIVPLLTLTGFIFFAVEMWMAWYGQNQFEWFLFSENRVNMFRPYGWSYWLMITGNYILPQLLWFKKLRKSIPFTLLVVVLLNTGVWFERMVIWITSSYRDYLPSSWSTYTNSHLLFGIVTDIFCFAVVSAVTYFFFSKRKKLPFPGAILSYFLFFLPYFLFQCIHPSS